MMSFTRTMFLLASLFISCAIASQSSQSNPIDIISDPFHLSWRDKQSRYDFVFNLKEPLNNETGLVSVAASSLSDSLGSCASHDACLLKDGKFLLAYHKIIATDWPQKTLFKSVQKSNTTSQSNSNTECVDSNIYLHHFCSTHWNPPAHLTGFGCSHNLEWHSPYSCHTNQTNYERPCYVYDESGKLIDLTPWVQSNGSSYEVDTDPVNNTIKSFHLGVCNEATHACGPHVSACYVDDKNSIESGYNNLTSLKYDAKDKTVVLTSLGHYDERCQDKRIRTVVRFACKEKLFPSTRPRLIRTTACENIVEWRTIHACPVPEIHVPAANCSIKHDALGIDLKLDVLIETNAPIEVPIEVGGKRKKMILGICRGLQANQTKCEGKSNSQTSACLIDADAKVSELTPNNSQIVGSIMKSTIKLADDLLYLESPANNRTCQTPAGAAFNITRQLGTRIEFFCAPESAKKPSFLGYDDCTYLFEWGTPQMCLESLAPNKADEADKPIEVSPPSGVEGDNSPNKTKLSQSSKLSDKELKTDLNEQEKSAHELHQDTVADSKKMVESSKSSVVEKNEMGKQAEKTDQPQVVAETKKIDSGKSDASPVASNAVGDSSKITNRMNNLHKFFMIGLIVASLAGFIVVIFILDKKTRMGIPLGSLRRQARQTFQQQPVPYTRVNDFNDSLDL